jgi:shikimate kinase
MTIDPQRGQGLALVGARGTGKTTVGRLVAARVGRTFIDLDEWIERDVKMAIGAYFSQSGERAFRKTESRVLGNSIIFARNAVIATGGGVVLSDTNRQLLREFGFVVWLTADPDELAARLEADPRGLASRPALTPAGTLAEIAEVLAVRTPLYREIADAVVDTTGRNAVDVARAVIAAWERSDGFARGAP